VLVVLTDADVSPIDLVKEIQGIGISSCPQACWRVFVESTGTLIKIPAMFFSR
jgi:hypothetical protein